MRKLSPITFKRYTTYKRYLQHEFYRVCVYCREVDSTAPSIHFSVDHYRPKALPEFKHLECEYSNLYYCCLNCNSRKSDYWPKKDEPRIANPCDDIMVSHLKLNPRTAVYEPRTADGRQMAKLLQLNEPEKVEFRKTTLTQVAALQVAHSQLGDDVKKVEQLFQEKKISKGDYEREILELQDQRVDLANAIERQTGTRPPPRLPRQRNGIKLSK